MSLMVAALLALPLAVSADPLPNRPELAVAISPGLVLPLAYGLEAGAGFDRFRFAASLTPGNPGYAPFWGAWTTVGVVGSLRVIGGALTSVSTPSCPASPGVYCPTGPLADRVVPFAGLALHTDIGDSWFEFRPWVALAGAGAAYPPYSLVNAFMAGPPTLEWGWQVTPHVGFGLRSCIVPLKVWYTF